jgi:hypothetical protein
MLGKIIGDGIRKDLVPFPVDCTHPADVARKLALIDETRECRLRKGRRMPVADEFRLMQGLL